MKKRIGTKLTVQLQKAGEEKYAKQTLANIVNDPEEAKILGVGEALASFAPTTARLVSVIEIQQNEYTK